MDDQLLLIQKMTHLLIGTYDFRNLARQAVDLICSELKEANIVTAAIGRIHENDNLVYAYAYSTKHQKIIDKLLPRKFAELYISLTSTDNLAVRTILTNQIQQSKRMADFSRGILPDELADRIQKIMGGKLTITLPIRLRSGKVAGVLLLVLSQEKISAPELVAFETVAGQLSLAFSNVIAFEKLMSKYQNSLKLGETEHLTEDEVPNIKFTLRISPKQNRNLTRLAREKGKTKAELIRELLDKI